MSASSSRVWLAITLFASAVAIGFWYGNLDTGPLEAAAESQGSAPVAPLAPAAARRIIDPDQVRSGREAIIPSPPTTLPAVSTRLDPKRHSISLAPGKSPCEAALGLWHLRPATRIQLMSRGKGQQGGAGTTFAPFQWTCSGNGDMQLDLSEAVYHGRHEPQSDVLELVDAAGNAVRATRAATP
jgi:hypothetical protein